MINMSLTFLKKYSFYKEKNNNTVFVGLLLILLFVQIYSQTYKRQQQITRASQNKLGKCKHNHIENILLISNVICFYRQISSCNVM